MTTPAKMDIEILSEAERYHPRHLGEGGGCCPCCALKDLLKQTLERNVEDLSGKI